MTEPTVSSQQIYNGRALSVRIDTVETPGGRTTTREIVEHRDGVAVVALDEKDNAIMVRQFRKAIERTLLEIPAGGIEEGEQPVDCVRRELQEEIGMLPKKIEKIGGFYLGPGYCTEYLYLYLATDLEPSQLEAEDTEDIEVVKVPLAQISRLIATGEIIDCKSVAGLLRIIQLGLSGAPSST